MLKRSPYEVCKYVLWKRNIVSEFKQSHNPISSSHSPSFNKPFSCLSFELVGKKKNKTKQNKTKNEGPLDWKRRLSTIAPFKSNQWRTQSPCFSLLRGGREGLKIENDRDEVRYDKAVFKRVSKVIRFPLVLLYYATCSTN